MLSKGYGFQVKCWVSEKRHLQEKRRSTAQTHVAGSLLDILPPSNRRSARACWEVTRSLGKMESSVHDTDTHRETWSVAGWIADQLVE